MLDFGTVGENPLFSAILSDFVTDPAASRAFRIYRQDIAQVDGLLNIYPTSLGVLARGPDMLLGYVETLDDNQVLLGYNAEDPARSAFMVAGNNLNSVIFFHVYGHFLHLVSGLAAALRPLRRPAR